MKRNRIGQVLAAGGVLLSLMGGLSASAQSISGQIVDSSTWKDTFVSDPGDGDGQGQLIVALLDTEGVEITRQTVTSGALPLPRGPYSYAFGGSHSNGDYSVVAWVDGDMNGVLDEGEPYGQKGVTITAGLAARNQRVFVTDDNSENGLPDWWEWHWFYWCPDPYAYGPGSDPDGDGLTNLQEANLAIGNYGLDDLDPANWDSDGDGMDDGWEVLHFDLDPTSGHFLQGMNPTISDATSDFDGDGLSNWQEYCGVDGKPRLLDGVGDEGITKGVVVSSDDLNPLDVDTDFDLLLDSFEAAWYDPVHNIDPRSGDAGGTNGFASSLAIAQEDSDHDGLTNFREQCLLKQLKESSANSWLWRWGENGALPFVYDPYTDINSQVRRICIMTEQGSGTGQALNLHLIPSQVIPFTNRFLLRGHAWTDPTEGTGYFYADENIPPGHDTDDDGLPDGWEVQFDLDPRDDGFGGVWDDGPYGDPDGDGLMNVEEYYGQDGERSVTTPFINGTGDETNPNLSHWRPDSTYEWRWYNSGAVPSGLGSATAVWGDSTLILGDPGVEVGDPGVGLGINRWHTLGGGLPTTSLGADSGYDSDDDGLADLDEINPPLNGTIPSSPVDSCDPFIPRAALITSAGGIAIPAPETASSNKYHLAGSRADLQRRDWTLECQVRLLGTNLSGDLFNFESVFGGQGAIVYRLSLSNNAPVLTAHNTRPALFTVSGNALPTNRWVHLAAVWDHRNNALSLYIDGILALSPQPMDESFSKYMFPATNELVLAASPDGSFVNRLLIDEVRVWGLARTAVQIAGYARRLVPPVNGDDVWVHGTDYDTVIVNGGGVFEREPGLPLAKVYMKDGNYWIDDGDGKYDAAKDTLLKRGTNLVAGISGTLLDNVYWNDKDNSGDFTRNALLAYYRFDDGGATAEDFARRAKNGLTGAASEEYRFGDFGYALSTNFFSFVTNEAAPVYGVDRWGADDSDHDGLPDAWEVVNGLDPWDDGTWQETTPGAKDGPNGPAGDPDHDGLVNRYEFWSGTNPRSEDSDGNGVLDTQQDRDGDGVVNIAEQLLGSRPDMVDTDDDGLGDNEEQGMGTSPVNAVDPAISRAVSLGGSLADFLEIPGKLDQRMSSWTLECWMNPSNAVQGAGTLIRRVVETLDSGTQVVNYVMGLETNAAGLRLYAGYVGSDGRPYILRGGIVASAGSWTHVAASYNTLNATLNLYTNGALVASTNTFYLAPPVSGRGGETFVRMGEDFAGRLDEVRIWNVVRTAAQIQANTNRVITSGDTNGLIHYFRFDDGQAVSNHFPWGTYNQPAGFQDFTYDHDWNEQWRHAATAHGNVTATLPGAIVPPPSLRLILQPDEVVLAGAQWSIDSGGSWQNSGDSVQGLTPGSHSVMYKSVAGWTKPVSEVVELTNGVATTMTRLYVQQASLVVRFDDVLTPTGAAWRVNGGAWMGGGVTVSNINAGTNTVSYSPVPGWFEPAVEQVFLNPGQVMQLLREYTVMTSAVTVILVPTNAVAAGAQWRVDGGGWMSSGEQAGGLTLSSHQVQFASLPRWITPASVTFVSSNATPTVLTGLYSQVTGLAVDITPPEAVAAGAQWRITGGVWTNSGALLQVPAGSYSVEFLPVSGDWLTPAGQQAVVLNQQVTALSASYLRAEIFGSIGSNAGSFWMPRGLALDSRHRLYVADTYYNRLQLFDPLTSSWTIIGTAGTGIGQFSKPNGVAVDARGNLYVADQNNYRVQKWTATNSLWSVLSSNTIGSALGQFNSPSDVAVDSSFNLYVADVNNHRIQKYTTQGVWSVFITNGLLAGQVHYPRSILVDKDDVIYVTDDGLQTNGLNRIQKFNRNGQFLSQPGSGLSAEGGLRYPGGVAHSGSSLYVADITGSRVAVTPLSGMSWTTLVSSNILSGPEDVEFDPRGFLYIADTLNNRILRVMIDSAAATNGVASIASMVSSGTNTSFTLSWFGRQDWFYAVQFANGLAAPVVWQILPGCTNIAGMDRMTNCTDRAVLGITNRFYRILGY